MDSTVTITWTLLDPENKKSISDNLSAFLACMRDWQTNRSLPTVWVYVHEEGPVVGSHTHLAIYLPPDPTLRKDFRAWVKGWARRKAGRSIACAVRVRSRGTVQTWLHWLNFHYFCKGYDPQAVIAGGSGRLDQKNRYLGDLIAFRWREPGSPAANQRYGVSDAIGPGHQELGVPGVSHLKHYAAWRRDHPFVDPFNPGLPLPDEFVHRRVEPFRSAYQNGSRDVRELYPKEFLAQVDRHWVRPPLPQDLPVDVDQAVSCDDEELEMELALQNSTI